MPRRPRAVQRDAPDSPAALRRAVTTALIDSAHEASWSALTTEEQDQIIEANRGVAGLKSYRERLLSGEHGIPGAVHHALMSRGLN